MPTERGDSRTKPTSRFLRHLLQPVRRHRDWTVNEPAKRTNRRGDSPRGSPRVSPRVSRASILLLLDWASRRGLERKREREESTLEKRELLYRLNGAYSGSGFHGLQAVSFVASSFFFFSRFFRRSYAATSQSLSRSALRSILPPAYFTRTFGYVCSDWK